MAVPHRILYVTATYGFRHADSITLPSLYSGNWRSSLAPLKSTKPDVSRLYTCGFAGAMPWRGNNSASRVIGCMLKSVHSLVPQAAGGETGHRIKRMVR